MGSIFRVCMVEIMSIDVPFLMLDALHRVHHINLNMMRSLCLSLLVSFIYDMRQLTNASFFIFAEQKTLDGK